MSTISASTTSTTAYKVTADTTGTLVLQTGATPTTAVTIDASQNMGLGVTPPTTSGGKLFNLNQVGAGIHATSNADLNLVNNAYYNGAWLYGITGFSARYQLTDNAHRWFSAASGTAGNAITFTQAMTLDASGNLSVGGSAARGTTAGTAAIQLFNGTAPVGTLTNGVSMYSASGDLSFMDAAGNSYKVGYRNVPQNSQTSAYVLVASDVGKHISITTGGVTCNASIFSAGDVLSIYNNSGSNQTITAGASVTFRLAGTATTGNRTLAQYGVATLLCVTGGATPVFVISGAGVT